MKNNVISTTIANNYSTALFEVAEKNNKLELFKVQLHQVLELLSLSTDLRVVVENSSISIGKKLEILNCILKDRIDEKLLHFLNILIEKNRFDELESISYTYDNMLEKHSNRKTVEIYSPIALNFENKTNVLFKLEHKLNCEISPVWKIDESLIAGLAFKIGDTVIDTSIRSKLENLSKKISR